VSLILFHIFTNLKEMLSQTNTLADQAHNA